MLDTEDRTYYRTCKMIEYRYPRKCRILIICIFLEIFDLKIILYIVYSVVAVSLRYNEILFKDITRCTDSSEKGNGYLCFGCFYRNKVRLVCTLEKKFLQALARLKSTEE